MSKIPPHIIDEIMQTARIEEVIGDFVSLKKRGSNYMGLSPFTDEKTPSFSVSPSKQIFKCFSTGKGGNAVSFLMEKEHFSYPEALRWLADKYGVQIPEEAEPTAEELASKNERDSLFIINEFAKTHFVHNLLNTEEGQAVGLSYFEERGFRRDIIERFQLGYSLNISDDFTKAALAKGYKLEFLENVGLVKSKDDRQFDFFRGRVMFPIHSVSGRVLGFGGRTLFTDKKVAKYFNSPESLVYNKSEILYGLYYAKGDIVKYDECLLCEGYTDVISMHQAGIQNAVSSSGTSLTKEQIKLVKRYTQNITILYDGDAAGIKASFRGIDLILEEGMNVKVVLFPDGEDPDSFSKKNSSSIVEEFIKSNKQDFITFKASLLLGGGESDPLKKSELIKDIVHSVSLIPDTITRSVYVQEIARQFDISESIVSNELMRLRKNTLAKQLQEPEIRDLSLPENPVSIEEISQVAQQENKKATADEYEREIIRLMLQYGTREVKVPVAGSEMSSTSVIELVVDELSKDEMTLQHPLYSKVYSQFLEGLAENTLYQASVFLKGEDQEVVQLVADVQSNEIELSHNWITKHNIFTRYESDNLYDTMIHAIYSFKFKIVDLHLKKLRKELSKPDLNDEEMVLILSEQMSYEKVKKALSEKLGRTILK